VEAEQGEVLRRVATGAPLAGAGRVAARRGGTLTPGEDTEAEQGAGCRRVRLHRSTVYLRPAMTTPPPRCEHRGLLSPCAVTFSWSCLSACLRAAEHRRVAVFP
jgi:hypothetical protein